MAVLRKIRIGTDITLGITVMASGHAVDWESQDIKHVYAFSDVQGQPVAEMSYEQRGSTLRCVFNAEDQNYVGAYRVIIEFNDGSAFSSTLDMPAFEIVRTSEEADIDTGEIVLDIDGSMRFYSLAEVISKLEGLHSEVKAAASAAREASGNANEAAKKANEAAALANSNASKAEASNKVINDNERKRIAQETARESAEVERKRAELERQKGDESIAIKEAVRVRNEEVRETNEQTREDNELERRNAESARNRAEMQRAISETKRISNETSRQAAENKRAAAETSRQEAETSRVNVESERVTEFARLKKESEEATKAASAVSDVVAQHTEKINELTGHDEIASTLNLTGDNNWDALPKSIPANSKITAIKNGDGNLVSGVFYVRKTGGETLAINTTSLPKSFSVQLDEYNFPIGNYVIDFTEPAEEGVIPKLENKVDVNYYTCKRNLALTQKIVGGQSVIEIPVINGATINPDSKHDALIKAGSVVTLSVNIYDVMSSAPALYLWYADGEESDAFSNNAKLSIPKDVVAVGIYAEAAKIIKDGNIDFVITYDSEILKESKELIDGVDNSKVINLTGIAPDSSFRKNWAVGDLYFSTTDNVIRKCVTASPVDFVDTDILSRCTLFMCESKLYLFDGKGLSLYHEPVEGVDVILDYKQFLVGENINNDSTGGDRPTYIFKDLATIPIQPSDELEVTCGSIVDAKISNSIIFHGITATGESTEISNAGEGTNIVRPSKNYVSVLVRLYPTTSGMDALYATYNNLKIIKRKNSVVPAYYIKDDYLKNKIEMIRSKMFAASGDFDSFIFITDLHWPRNTKNSPAIINYLQDKIQIPRILMGGDYADGINMDYLKAFNDYRGKIYRAIGNHEYMNYWEEDGVFASKEVTDSQIWSTYQSGMTDIVIGDANTNYYYVDNTVQKMRYIFLSVFTDGSEGKFETAQATWLSQTLSNMPEGYLAVIVAHYLIKINYPDWKTEFSPIGKKIADICDTHIGKVACMLAGHTHEDMTMKTAAGIPIFVTTCDKANADHDETSAEDSFIYGKRTNGTINEQAFDVVVINKKDKKVSLVRIGCPADNEGGDPLEVREQTYL